jgi:hypothetical protein
LAERGFFRDPPSPVPAGEPGYVRFPPWPEGEYLVRMANHVPDEVAAVLSTIQQSDNPVVTRTLLKVAKELPLTQRRRLHPRIREWVDAPHADWFYSEASALATDLLASNEIGTAFAIIFSILRVLPDPRREEKVAAADSPIRPSLDAAARLSKWEYEQVMVQVLTPAVDTAGLRAVRQFSSLLLEALNQSEWADETETTGNLSYIWRPAIEDDPQNLETDIKDALVSAVRDASVQHASRGADQTKEVVETLEPVSTVHRRIALHVLTKTAYAIQLADERLMDRELFDDFRVRHEYAALLRNKFGRLPYDQQRIILGWIDAGPDVEAYRQRTLQFSGREPNESELKAYVDAWKRDRYSFIEADLDPTRSEVYQDLIRELGQPEHPDIVSWTTSWSGPETPIEPNELLTRTPEAVVAYLRQWHPEDDSGWHFGPSLEGLGRAVAATVAVRPGEFSGISNQFVDLDPTYVRAFFTGLEEALREGHTFGWEGPLALAAQVAGKPFEADVERSDRDRDPDWRWSRRQISSLIRSGLSEKPAAIPFHLRQVVWSIVERLSFDPNPSPEHETRYGGNNMDALTLSLNTNRGQAMHAVMEYALWCRRNHNATGNEPIDFDQMPEVSKSLEAHLDHGREPSLAVRAVYGRWLPWLILLDEAWVVQHIDMIFPQDPALTRFQDAAWIAYISWCPPYDSAYRVARAQYDNAVTRVPSGHRRGSFMPASPDAKLGEHLITFYWRDVIDLSVLNEYFERSDDELAAAAAGFVGRALGATNVDLPDARRSRLQALWELRFSVGEAAPAAHREELRAFGSWFISGKLDEAWALSMLDRVSRLVGSPSQSNLVAKKLAEISEHDPVQGVRILAQMIEGAGREWDYMLWRDESRAIASLAISSGVPEAEEHAREIVGFYTRRGDLSFRDLIRSS